MNWKQLGLGVVLADFAALNAYAVYQYGYVGVWELLLANAATTLAVVDLTIALGLVSLWMWRDARARGWSATPYLILTAFLGSVGPLLYLIRREGREPVPRAHALAAAR